MKIIKIAGICILGFILSSFVLFNQGNSIPTSKSLPLKSFNKKFTLLANDATILIDGNTATVEKGLLQRRCKTTTTAIGIEYSAIFPILEQDFFSRMGPPNYDAAYRIAYGNNTLYIYSQYYSTMHQTKSYFAMVLDDKGNIIGSEVFLGYNKEEFTKGSIHIKDQQIEVNYMEQFYENERSFTYKFDFDEQGAIYRLEKIEHKV